MSTKWLKNISGETRSFLGTQVADDAFYQIATSKLAAIQENQNILSWIAAEEVRVSEDGSTTIDSVSAGLASLLGVAGPKDTDLAPLTRVKMFKSGVAVRFHFFSITTSKYSGAIRHKKSDGSTDFGYITSKIYDNTDTEITSTANEGNAVKTVVDFEPPSIDYEIIAGKFYQDTAPATDIYVHVVAVPDVPENFGGSISFCSDANLKHMGAGQAFETDGRVPKKMVYDATNHTSKIRIIFYHDAGVQHDCMGELEIAH